MLSWSAEFNTYGDDTSDNDDDDDSTERLPPPVKRTFASTAPIPVLSTTSSASASLSVSGSTAAPLPPLSRSPRLRSVASGSVAAELEHVRSPASLHSLASMRSSSASSVLSSTTAKSSACSFDAAAPPVGVLEAADNARPGRGYSVTGSDAYVLVDDDGASADDEHALVVVDDRDLQLYSSCSVSTAYTDGSDPYERPSQAATPQSSTMATVASLRRADDRDWTGEWLALLDAPLLERGQRMAQLRQEFVEASEALAKLIVDQRGVPEAQRTLVPVSGGVCGGQKFFRAGIFAKYCVDVGGIFGSDHKAMKAGALDALGLQTFANFALDLNVNVPLLAVVDYSGHRIVTMSTLPISNQTLVYGSPDGGARVRRTGPLAEVIDQACAWLNLAEHDVGGASLRGPFDLEGHDVDGVWFAVDFARLLPPEAPLSSEARVKDRGCCFYKLLRPEFCRRWRTALCADGFTRFSTPALNRELTAATLFLRNTLVPRLARELLLADAAAPRATDRSVQQACADLVRHIHFVGVNIRHLGLVATAMQSEGAMPPVKRVLLLEMIARIVKNRLRAMWRALPSAAPGAHWRRVFDFLATVFDSANEENAFWWTVEVKLALRTEFDYQLSATELSESWDVRAVRFDDQVDFVRALYGRVTLLAGFALSTDGDFVGALRKRAAIQLIASSKPFSIAPRLEADCLVETARKSDADSATTLYELAFVKYEAVLRANTDDLPCLLNFAIALHRAAKLIANRGARDRAEAHFVRSQSLLHSALELLGLQEPGAGSRPERRVSSLRDLFVDPAAPGVAIDSSTAFRVLLILANSYLAHAIMRNTKPVEPPAAAAKAPVGALRRSVALLSLHVPPEAVQWPVESIVQRLRLAVGLYERASGFVEQAHNDSLMLLNWAFAHHLLGQLEPRVAVALEHFERAKTLYDDACGLLCDSAVPFKRTGIAHIERCVWLRKRVPMHTPADVEKQLAEAERLLRRAEQLEQGSGAFYLGCTFALRGDEANARLWLDKALETARRETLPSADEALRSEWLADVRERPWFAQWLKRLGGV